MHGPAGSGKSHWAAARDRAAELISSDAFAVLDFVVRARLPRGLTTVDTLGLDDDRRPGYLALAREHLVPAVAMLVVTPDALRNSRNGQRDRPVPAPALARQARRGREVADAVHAEGWDVVQEVDGSGVAPAPAPAAETAQARPDGLDVVLEVSRFPGGTDRAGGSGGSRAAPHRPRHPGRRVERQRGRTSAAVFAARQHAGTATQQRDRYLRLADEGVSTGFVAVVDLDGPDDLERLAPLDADVP